MALPSAYVFCRQFATAGGAFPMKRFCNLVACGAIVLAAMSAGEQRALAQARGAGGSMSNGTMFGSSGALSGANGFSTGSMGVSGAGTGMPPAGFGAQAPMGFGAAFGSSAGRAGSQQAGNGLIDTNLGQPQGGFVGNNDNAGRFVGSAQAGRQQIVGQNRNGQMNRGNRNGGNNRGQQNNNQNFMQQQMGGNPAQQQRQVRPQLRLGFEYNPPAAATLDATLSTRFEKLTERLNTRGKFGDVRVTAEGQAVTLRGQVASENDRRLAGIMARMEPGVSSVQNELTVQAPPKAPTTNGNEP